jgi:RHS repeat-associated protein
MQKTRNGIATSFAWDQAAGLPLLLEESTDGASTSYVTGPRGFPLEEVTPSGDVLFYHQDQLGSTRMLTDSSGASVETYSYDAYGNDRASGSVDQPLRFAGQYRDNESALYYLRARYYDPMPAQLVSRDLAAQATRQPYGYAAENPVNAADPSGLACWPWQLFNGQCDYQIHGPSLDQLEQNREALKGTFAGDLIRFDPLIAAAEDVNARWHCATDVSDGDLIWDAIGVGSLGVGVGGELLGGAATEALQTGRALSWWHPIAKFGYWIKGTSLGALSSGLEAISTVGRKLSDLNWLWSDLKDWTQTVY